MQRADLQKISDKPDLAVHIPGKPEIQRKYQECGQEVWDEKSLAFAYRRRGLAGDRAG